MGARRRSLTRAAVSLVSLGYAMLVGALLLAAAELFNAEASGPWLDVVGAAVLGLALLSTVLLIRTALLRRRERLTHRAWGWSAAAAATALVGLAALLFLATVLPVEPTFSGADVRAARPVLHSLPVPPRARLVSERPGPAGTESIVADYRVPDLSQVAAFYRGALPESGWTSLDATPSDVLLRYQKGEFAAIVVIDPTTGNTDYTVTVDRTVVLASPTVSPT